jgi:hypothetical protein
MKYLLTALILSLIFVAPCSAQDTQSIGIEVSVGTINPTFNIAVTPINAETDAWGTAVTSPPYNIDFGTLTADTENNILVANQYYAVDVGVVSNVPWTVSYSATSITGPSGNLNNNVNVTFVGTTGGDSETELSKTSYANAMSGVSYTDANFGSGEWLRLYYGIGTGETSQDAAGVEPIPIDTPTGNYSGTVTLSVTAR